MRRTDGLYDISRRELCVALAGGAALALCGCTDGGTGAIGTGALGGPGDLPPDAHQGSGSGTGTDGGTGDATIAATCNAGATDVGAASTFVANTPVYFSTGKFFVVRDSGGLYALTARCTHEGVVCNVSGHNFVCPRHGATFTINGSVVSGPVISGLVHYAMCTLANGHVGVETATTVSQATRLVA